jgi:UrcA family protein
MKESNLKKVYVAASFALVFAAPVVANAGNYSFHADSGALRVSYSDLNLSSEEGISTLYARLQSASRLACATGSYQQLGSLRAKSSADKCFAKVLSKLVAKVDSEKLTAVHES